MTGIENIQRAALMDALKSARRYGRVLAALKEGRGWVLVDNGVSVVVLRDEATGTPSLRPAANPLYPSILSRYEAEGVISQMGNPPGLVTLPLSAFVHQLTETLFKALEGGAG